MPIRKFSVLIVDDEQTSRKILEFAFQKEGFRCFLAKDGAKAMGMLKSHDFDLMVTDLKMPNKNGHSLAVDVLGWDDRPLIAIHTSVVDPAIARDLMIRGVDDLVFKPTNYLAFAAKMKAMVERRTMANAEQAAVPVPSPRNTNTEYVDRISDAEANFVRDVNGQSS